jgi:hypothetical protein
MSQVVQSGGLWAEWRPGSHRPPGMLSIEVEQRGSGQSLLATCFDALQLTLVWTVRSASRVPPQPFTGNV